MVITTIIVKKMSEPGLESTTSVFGSQYQISLIIFRYIKPLGAGNGSVVSTLDFHPISWGSNPNKIDKRPSPFTIQELS